MRGCTTLKQIHDGTDFYGKRTHVYFLYCRVLCGCTHENRGLVCEVRVPYIILLHYYTIQFHFVYCTRSRCTKLKKKPIRMPIRKKIMFYYIINVILYPTSRKRIVILYIRHQLRVCVVVTQVHVESTNCLNSELGKMTIVVHRLTDCII